MVRMRGRSFAGVEAKWARTWVAEVLFVSTTVGVEDSSTAVRWSAWPGSVGSYSGTGTVPAYSAPMKPKRYSGLLLARMTTRSPRSVTCCRRTHTALMRVLTSARVQVTSSPAALPL